MFFSEHHIASVDLFQCYMYVRVTDVLAADKQLAIEIEFDMRKFEEREKQKKQKKSSSVPVSCLTIHTFVYCLLFTRYIAE